MGKKPLPAINPKSGPLAFDLFYRTLIGDRWEALQASCRLPSRHFQLQTGLRQAYFLDPASVFAALQLDVQPGHSVLDLCAAPGGKCLTLAQSLFGLVAPGTPLSGFGNLVTDRSVLMDIDVETGASDTPPQSVDAPPDQPDSSTAEQPQTGFGRSRLVANERSATRRGRLRSVLSDHLPPACLAAISITGHDATGWGQYQQDIYDRILLDVPCSSERHLIQSPSYLREWSASRTRQLAQQAYAMGLSAGRALKPGGLLLYCTCALSTLENDQTVARIIERSLSQSSRYGFHLEIERPPAGQVPATEYLEVEQTGLGNQVWPDNGEAFGPLYFSRLRKIID